NLPTLRAADFEALPGRGAQARVNGKSVIIGGPRLLSEDKVTVPRKLKNLRPPGRPRERRFSLSSQTGDCSALSLSRTRFGPNPMKPSRNFISLVSRSQ